MNIREFKYDDIYWERDIYSKFHSENEYPGFESNYHFAFIVESDNGKIILAGGVKPIAEVVLLTDLRTSVRNRVEAAHKALEASIYTAARFDYKELHAFTHPLSRWGGQLAKVGFKQSENKVHILDLTNGKE